MRELNSIRLSNIGVYKDLVLENLQDETFVTIGGLNKDSKDVADNTNGAGKSMLFSTLPVLMFEADPLALAKKSKSTFLSKDGKIDIEYTAHNNKRYRVVQTATKYQVFEDGVDLETHKGKQEVAREWIEKTFPLSQDEFYSYVYIQTQIPHPVQRAKPSDRLKYFTDVFDLHVYDKMRQAFHEKFKKAAEAEQEAKGIADALDISRRKQEALLVTKGDRKQNSEDKDHIAAKHAEISELKEEQVQLEVESASAVKYEKLIVRREALGIRSENPKKELKEIAKELKDIESYEQYVEELQEYKEQKATLKKDLEAIGVDCSDTEKLAKRHAKLNDKADSIEEEIENAREQIQSYEEYQAKRKSLKKRFSECITPKQTEEKIKNKIAEEESIVKAYNKLSKHVEDSECPTCGAELDMANMKKAAKRAAASIDKLEESMVYWDLTKELDKLVKVSKPEFNIKAAKKELKSLEEKIESIEGDFKRAVRYGKIEAKLEALVKPKKIKHRKGTKAKLEEKYDKLEDLVEINHMLSALTAPTTSFDKLCSRLKKIKHKVRKASDEIAKVDAKVQALQFKIQEYDFHTEMIAELEGELAKMQKIIDKKQVYEALYKAYANTALKLDAMVGNLQQLENSLNKYSHLVFPEPVKFSLGTNKQGIEFNITRVSSGQTTDVIYLSGAETNYFRMLYALAMMPLVPAHRRPNFMILDEPENSCGPATRQHIIDNFIPVLKQVVPTIFWITPQEVSFSDTQWTVIKEGGHSTLHKKDI